MRDAMKVSSRYFLNRSRQIFLALVTLVLFWSVTAAAQIISVEPDAWDYGGVEVGDTEYMMFTVTDSKVGTSLNVTNVLLVNDYSEDYSISDVSPPLPALIDDSESMEVTVAFTPTTEGVLPAFLLILSDCEENPALYIPLLGEGLAYEPPPEEVMQAVMDFYASGIADGSIYGLGSGAAPASHIRIFGGILDAADDLIAAGDDAGACFQLEHAVSKSDGLDAPPDFIGGPGVAPLNAMILLVIEALDC